MNPSPMDQPAMKSSRPYVPAAKHLKLRESRDRVRGENLALKKRLEIRERRIELLEARLERSKRAGLAALADWQHEYITVLESCTRHPDQDADMTARLAEIRRRGELLR